MQQLQYLLDREASGDVADTSDPLSLSRMAAQLHQNALQLVANSRLIVASINEIYRNRDKINDLEKKVQSNTEEIEILKNPQNQIAEDYITPGQANVLKAKVQTKAKGRKAVTVWGKFRSYFGVTRYKFLPQSKFDEACVWLDNYEE